MWCKKIEPREVAKFKDLRIKRGKTRQKKTKEAGVMGAKEGDSYFKNGQR